MAPIETYIAQRGAEASAAAAGAPGPSPFMIVVRFLGGLTDRQKQAFKGAANRWTKAIIGDLPSVFVDGETIDDLLILAQGAPIDGPGRILGQAGPTRLRPQNAGKAAFLPAKGEMTFDTTDLAQMEAAGTLDDVITHEMGHVIGIGTIWSRKGLVHGLGTMNPVFLGQNAQREFGKLRGVSNSLPVPVENTGGPGTAGGHWRDTVFGNELMTGFVNEAGNPLSLMTLESLHDLGYEIDPTAAEPYTLPTHLELAASGALGQPEEARGVVITTIPQLLPDDALVAEVKQEPGYDKGGRLGDLIAAADDSVKAALSSGQGLQQFLATIDKLTEQEMNDIAEQAIVLLQSFYVHLPLKRAMHAVDPLQRLRLLQPRIPQIKSEIAFHHEVTDIFTSLRDLHTNYILPSHFARMVAFLPFRVEACIENGVRKYIVANVAGGFNHPTFVRGVEIRYWNGIPIERAVEIAASYHAGSNSDARHARGVDGLTKRAMNISPPPDEEWVTINYIGLDQQAGEIRIDWTVSGLPSEAEAGLPQLSLQAASAFGLDLEGDTFQRINKMLFAQDVIAAKRNIEQIKTAAVVAAGASFEAAVEIGTAAAEQAVAGTASIMPDKIQARVVEVNGKKYAYIRIFSFNVPSDVAFVNEIVRLLELPEMPKTGLILDVRANGGGLIWAGERLLQLFTPKNIEPTRFQFINTEANLRLCRAASDFRNWEPSIERALQTGATFSAAFPITAPERCNDIGQRYYGPVVLITDARCYSTTDIFTAGFRDHSIGTILGVDGNTGAGGANVWTLGLINQFFAGAGLPAPLQSLPKNADLRVAIRRTLRVGPESGTELEDLGVTPDERHELTRNDVLQDNVDLIKHAAQLLSQKPVCEFQATPSRVGGNVRIDLVTNGVDYVDVFLGGRPQQSRDIVSNAVQLEFPAAQGAKIELRGYGAGGLVCSRRILG